MPHLLEIENLVVEFPTDESDKNLRAVNHVSLHVDRGTVLGLVGESGAGKSITGLSIMGLVDEPGKIASGRIMFDGQDLTTFDLTRMRQMRGRRIAMVFQDPMLTLNPVLRIGTQMTETLYAHQKISRKKARARARDALAVVGIPSPEERLDAYPHQFSGGMRQRVVIAIALLHNPDLIIADEPTTALDVTIESQILAEFQKLISERNMGLIWITHDLSVVSRISDRISVMYAGRIVESGSVADIISHPYHPYTKGLIESVPSQNPKGQKLRQIPGLTPSLARLPSGCSFRPRCYRANEDCLKAPERSTVNGREYFCHHPVSKRKP